MTSVGGDCGEFQLMDVRVVLLSNLRAVGAQIATLNKHCHYTSLTSVDERVLGLETSVVLVLVGVEADDEDVVHRDEQPRQLIDVGAAVTTVKRYVEEVLERHSHLRVDVDVVVRAPARTACYIIMTSP